MDRKEYRKRYYEKNKKKWEKYYELQLTDPVKHKKRNEKTKQWKLDNPEKAKTQKKKDDAKYHNKMKSDPDYLKKRRDAATEYNNLPEVKAHRKKIQSKHRTKPEVKKQNAEYNKKWAEENPDLVLENNKRHMKRLAAKTNLSWTMLMSQLKGWAKIIQQDCNETCQTCGDKSTQAHHIIHKTLYPDLAFNRSNGIALCDQCQYEVHGKML